MNIQGDNQSFSQGGGGGMLLRLGYNIMGYGAWRDLSRTSRPARHRWRRVGRQIGAWERDSTRTGIGSQNYRITQPLEMSFFFGGAALIKL